MKKSELNKYIRENIISTLSEDTDEEIAKTKELTTAVKDLNAAKKEAGIEEANIGLADLEEMGYIDGEKAFDMHFDKSILNNTPDTRAYAKGFIQAVIDSGGSLRLDEDATPLMKDFTYDYEDIGQFYLEGFGKEHTLNNDQLRMLGKKITDNLYGGDIGKAYDAVYKSSQNSAAKRLADRGALKNPRYVDGTSIKEDEDKEPTKSDIKKTKGLAKAKDELALLTREMKSLAKKYSKAEGEEKEKLVKVLKDKTKLKKELESIVDK